MCDTRSVVYVRPYALYAFFGGLINAYLRKYFLDTNHLLLDFLMILWLPRSWLGPWLLMHYTQRTRGLWVNWTLNRISDLLILTGISDFPTP